MKRLLLLLLCVGCEAPAGDTPAAPPPVALTSLPKAASNARGVDYPAATVYRTPPPRGYPPTYAVTSVTSVTGAGGAAADPLAFGGAAAEGGAFP